MFLKSLEPDRTIKQLPESPAKTLCTFCFTSVTFSLQSSLQRLFEVLLVVSRRNTYTRITSNYLFFLALIFFFFGRDWTSKSHYSRRTTVWSGSYKDAVSSASSLQASTLLRDYLVVFSLSMRNVS